MFDLMEMMQQMQQKMNEQQASLNDISIEVEAGEGKIKIIATAAKHIKNISIDPTLLEGEADVEEIEDLLVIAVNRALEKADAVSKEQMTGLANGLLPPGFDVSNLL